MSSCPHLLRHERVTNALATVAAAWSCVVSFVRGTRQRTLRDMRRRASGGRHQKDQMLNDFVNTGIVAALLSGFALDNFQDVESNDATALERCQAISMYFAVHMTTFSAISAALLYRVVNNLDDEAAHNFGEKSALLREAPFYVFVAGGGLYIVGVVFNALAAAEDDSSTTAKNILYVVYSAGGAMCCMALLYFLVVPVRLADSYGQALPEGGSRRRVEPSVEPAGAYPAKVEALGEKSSTREVVRDEMMAVLRMMNQEQPPPS